MHKFISYILPSFFLALSTTLFSNEICDDPCPPCNPCIPCPPKDPCAKCAQLWPTCGPDWIITPGAGPCVANGADISIHADFIYWTIRQEHMGFARTNQIALNLDTPTTSKGKTYYPDWNLEPGFKVGLGILFDCDGWDLYSEYTWLRTKTTKTAVSFEERFLFDLSWAGPGLINIERADHNWNHDFNVVDLELGRNFFISQCVHLRPYIGLKGTWQKQQLNLVDTGTISFPDLPANAGALHALHHLHTWGVGIRAGLDSAWHFNRCFSLVGQVAVSALWEGFNASAKTYLQDLTTQLFSVLTNIKSRPHSLHPVLEMYLGLRFEDWFCCDEYHYSLEAGWEEQWWNNQNQFIAFTEDVRLGDLFLQGLTIKFRFDF